MERGQRTQNGQRSSFSKKKVNSRVETSSLHAGPDLVTPGSPGLAGEPGAESYQGRAGQKDHRKEGAWMLIRRGLLAGPGCVS